MAFWPEVLYDGLEFKSRYEKIELSGSVGSNFDFYQEPQGFEDPIGSFFFQECLWSKNFYQLVTQEQIFTLMHGDEKVVCEIFR